MRPQRNIEINDKLPDENTRKRKLTTKSDEKNMISKIDEKIIIED